jgi:hypothetical protein
MQPRKILSIMVAAAMLLPFSYASVASAQDLDRDRDQLKTQQQLQDRDRLQTKDKLQTKDQLKEKDQIKEQERTRERERMREHMQTERPDKPQHERPERGGGGGRH